MPAEFGGGGQHLIGSAPRAVHKLADAGDGGGNLAGADGGAVNRLGDLAGDEILLMDSSPITPDMAATCSIDCAIAVLALCTTSIT